MNGALHCLHVAEAIHVQQRIAKGEVLSCTCLNPGHRYDVFQGGKKMFYAEETTKGCCARQWQICCPDAAPLDVSIDFVGSGVSEQAFRMTKACTPCTFLCINRPVTQVTDGEGNLLGSIRDPCACCRMCVTFDLLDERGETLLQVESGCFQWGFCCPAPCGPSKMVEFPVQDLEGKEAGLLEKRMGGSSGLPCCSSRAVVGESYQVKFAEPTDARSKALLMALAIFTDYRYFSATAEQAASR